MTIGHRIHFAEMLRRARDERLLTLAVANGKVAARDSRRYAMGFSRIAMEIERSTSDSDSYALVSIETALRVLRETPDFYGVCARCGTPIAAAKLEREPWTDACDGHDGVPPY